MVRPAALYNKARFSRDIASLGRVVAVLCGNPRISRNDLTDAELSSLEEIENENEEMDKATAKEARRKAEYRAAKLAGQNAQAKCPEMSQGQTAQAESPEMSQGQTARPHQTTIQPTNLPYNQPTVQPTEHNNTVSVCVRAPAPAPEVRADRHDVPTLKTVVDAATSVMNVSEGYARWWYAEMEARDWTASDGMRISTRNWRPQLKSWWNRAKPEERDEADRLMRKREAAKPKTYAPKDWALCEEQCACYLGSGRCRCGHVVPPDQRPHRIPPTECQHFVELKAEAK